MHIDDALRELLEAVVGQFAFADRDDIAAKEDAADAVAADFAANDPRALQALVDTHGFQVRQFPDEILEAGAKAASELLAEIRESGDALTKKTAESFVAGLNIVRQKTDGTDSLFLRAREQYFIVT